MWLTEPYPQCRADRLDRNVDCGGTVKRVCHALLTEDEGVLLHALEPRSTDRVLALFAYGNGDAALAILQAVPQMICAHDLFDQAGLTAQMRLKQWLFENLDCTSLRKFIGVDGGWNRPERIEIIRAMLQDLPIADMTFWMERTSSLGAGMACSDSTHKWTTRFRRFRMIYSRMPAGGQSMLLWLAMPLVSMFFPREERRHSLGYRQMMQNPQKVVGALMDRSKESVASHSIVPYSEFGYLSTEGHAVIREHLHRLKIVEQVDPNAQYDKIYFSNVIDYVPCSVFHGLLETVLRDRSRPRTVFLNSTYESAIAHPSLRRGLEERLFWIDWERTNELRDQDRVRVYRGLTVLRGM